MARKKDPVAPEITIRSKEWQMREFSLLGLAPFIHNRMTASAWRELILPSLPGAKRRDGLPKSDPIAEFQASPYMMRAPSSPTLLALISPMFKAAMVEAVGLVRDMVKKDVKRILHVQGERLPLFGGPTTLWMIPTKSSGMKKTPMIRTRARTEEWACRIKVMFLEPHLNEQGVANLLDLAGRVEGVGDARIGQGALNMGRFRIVSPDNPDFLRIVATGGRAVQSSDMEACAPWDDEVAEILEWYEEEIDIRGQRSLLRRPGVCMDRPPNGRQKAIAAAAAARQQ